MAKVITFSRLFPGYHPRAGQPTGFVEKFYSSIRMMPYSQTLEDFQRLNIHMDPADVREFFSHHTREALSAPPKHHTIRAGHRFEPGDMFSPRVWSGRPYNSKQIILAPPMQVVKTWHISITSSGTVLIDGEKGFLPHLTDQHELAANDGLAVEDFEKWFRPKRHRFLGFDGQIIAWSNKVKY